MADIIVNVGYNSEVDSYPWIPDRGGLSNNNTNNVEVSGYVTFSDIIRVTNTANVDALKLEDIAVSHGARFSLTGYDPKQADWSVHNGSLTALYATPKMFDIGINASNGGKVNITDGHEIHTVHGVNIDVVGLGGIPTSSVLVSNGSRTDTGTGYILITGADESVSSGSSVSVQGIQPRDITISHHAWTDIFEGIQVEHDDIIISNTATVVLTGVSLGGTISDVNVPCEIYAASMRVGYEFVKGQITEISQISLDSSIKLGVKLYSCDNTLLNVSTFTSAYLTFDDVLLLPANIDPISNLIYVIATPSDLSVLQRNKIYDMRVHVTDKSDNPSIVLVRKLRFI